jgi:hypothetical protein
MRYEFIKVLWDNGTSDISVIQYGKDDEVEADEIINVIMKFDEEDFNLFFKTEDIDSLKTMGWEEYEDMLHRASW